MKYYLLTYLMALTLSTLLLSCSTDNPLLLPETEQPVPPTSPDEPDDNNEPEKPDNNDDNSSTDNNPMSNNLRIIVGSASFNVSLEDNAAARAFKALLPMTVTISEMNGNEKYYYLPENLPTAASNPGSIQTGDLMLYGSSCLVLFYESFRTSYSYTRLGRVEDSSGLASALGTGNVSVTFEM